MSGPLTFLRHSGYDIEFHPDFVADPAPGRVDHLGYHPVVEENKPDWVEGELVEWGPSLTQLSEFAGERHLP